MKTYEVEIKRTSYVVCTVKAENEDDARDKAWLWYEGCGDSSDADCEINYCEEIAK